AMNDASHDKPSAQTPPPQGEQITGSSRGKPGAAKAASNRSRSENYRKAVPPDNGRVDEPLPDAAELSQQIAEIAQKSQNLVAEFLKRQNAEEGIGLANPLAIGAAFLEMTARLMSDPSRLVQAQLSLWNDYLTLWQRTTQRFLGGTPEPVIETPAGDRRF